MIHRTAAPCQTPSWQQQLASAFTRVEALLDYLKIDLDLLPGARAAAKDFSLRVPVGYAALMEPENPHDPLLRQVLPIDDELRLRPGFSTDPVGDLDRSVETGVLQKYHGRVLLITTGACGIHCRYCFRRHYPYSGSSAERGNWRKAIDFIVRSEQISEVILSGGDPLMLSDKRLAHLTRVLAEIPHVKRLRVHTRLPAVLPERITAEMSDWLSNPGLQSVLVLHINHAREITEILRAALSSLRATGVSLLNQSVLLRGVNDSPQALVELSEGLFAAGILPYYLHQLDPVQGAGHFAVPEPEAIELHRAVMRELPGYLVPRLVQEIPGSGSKTPLI